jgi:hypothetical protein
MLTAVVNVLLIAAIVYMLYSIAASNYKADCQINVYIDETNKKALIVPQKKASDEEIDEVACELRWDYTTRLVVNSNLNIRGAYRK